MKATFTKLAAWATLVLAPTLPAVAQQGPNPMARQPAMYNYYDDDAAGAHRRSKVAGKQDILNRCGVS